MTSNTPYLPPTVSGEHRQLPQVSQNRLANSLNNCNEVEASRVRVIAARKGADRVITVKADGMRYQPERIFEPFKCLEAAREGLGCEITVYFPLRAGSI